MLAPSPGLEPPPRRPRTGRVLKPVLLAALAAIVTMALAVAVGIALTR
jgi:hypothetical protein